MLGTALSDLHIIFILAITLFSRRYYYPYFTDEWHSIVCNLPTVTQVVSKFKLRKPNFRVHPLNLKLCF